MMFKLMKSISESTTTWEINYIDKLDVEISIEISAEISAEIYSHMPTVYCCGNKT